MRARNLSNETLFWTPRPVEHPGPRPGSRLSARLIVAIGLVWLAGLGGGFYLLAREEFTPVEGAVASPAFPAHSALTLAPDRPTLILFAHPHCPCTVATLHEFEQTLASLRGRVAATVVFPLPPGVPAGWEQGGLWRAAAKLPGVRVVSDRDGVEAARFGVRGSGHALLYDPSGALAFSGGLTASRGHEGDNPGRSAVIEHVLTGRAATARTPVYGCPLLESSTLPPS